MIYIKQILQNLLDICLKVVSLHSWTFGKNSANSPIEFLQIILAQYIIYRGKIYKSIEDVAHDICD